MNILDKNDPAFIFEALGRAAFNCKKGGDPYGFAKQEVYDNFISQHNLRGKRGLSAFLQKIINDKYDYNVGVQKDEISKLLYLENKIWETSSQDEIIDILELCIIEAEKLGY